MCLNKLKLTTCIQRKTKASYRIQILRQTLMHALVEQYLCLPLGVYLVPHMCILSFKGYQDKGYKDGAVKDYQLLQHKGLGELIEIKPQPGVSTVCTVNSRFPTAHPVCTIFEMLKVPINSSCKLHGCSTHQDCIRTMYVYRTHSTLRPPFLLIR